MSDDPRAEPFPDATGSHSAPLGSLQRSGLSGSSIEQAEQIERLVQELRRRWRDGNRDGLEELGLAFQDAATDPEQLLDLIYHEVLIREEFGDAPQLDEYTARFPGLAERLERLFAVHGALDDDGDWDAEFNAALRGDNVPGPVTPTIADGRLMTNQAVPPPRRDLSEIDAPPGYEIQDEIGRGGMAVVFRARQTTLNRTVALKMLIGGSIASPETLARFEQEARAVAQLQHPGIVQIHEVGQHRGLPYLSLEFVAGGTLHDWLHGRPLAPVEAARIVEQLARTTAFAHERGIVHRDLKPANVLLVEVPAAPQSGTPTLDDRASDPGNSGSSGLQTRISDFGLARMNDASSHLTATGQVIGTPSYMAPEQAAGSSDTVSPALDIYSLGAILYELLTGRPPFRGATLFETLEQVRSNDPVPPGQLQPRTPRDIETICLKCLEKNPHRRYASAAALATELRCFISGESISARPAGRLERCVKWVRRNPAVTVLTTLIVVLLIGAQAAILNEVRRANRHEQAAINDSRRADLERSIANVERQRAVESARAADQARRQAEDAQKQSEDARRDAVAAQAQAESDRALAIESRSVAEVALGRTLKALHSVADLGNTMRKQPGQEQSGQRLLDQMLELHDELLQDNQDNPIVRSQRVMALASAGEIHRGLHNFERAEALLKEAAELIDLEIQNEDENALDRLELCGRAREVWWNLGVIYKDNGQPAESIAAFERCEAACDDILRLQPQLTVFEVWRVNILTNMAVPLRTLGRNEEALEILERAVGIARLLAEENPGSSWTQSEAALAIHDYSMHLRFFQRNDEADAAFAESLAIRQANFAANPALTLPRLDLARSRIDQGTREIAAARYESGRDLLKQAESILAPLVARSPDIFDYQSRLIDALRLQAAASFSIDNRAEMEDVVGRLARQIQQTLNRFPQNPELNNLAQEWLYMHGNLLVARENVEAAVPFFEDAIEATRFLLEAQAPPDDSSFPGWYQYQLGWRLGTCPAQSLRQTEQALQLVEQARELSPQTSRYVHARGAILMEAGRYEEASHEFARSMALEETTLRQTPGVNSTPQMLEHFRRYHRLLQLLNWHHMGDFNAAAESFEILKTVPVVPLDSANHSDYCRYFEEARRLLEQPPK